MNCAEFQLSTMALFFSQRPKADKIKEEKVYQGVRVKFLTRLGNARIPVQVDVGFGDAVNSSLLDYPTLLPMFGAAGPGLPHEYGRGRETGGYCQPRHAQQPHERLLRHLVPRTNIPVPGGGSWRGAKEPHSNGAKRGWTLTA